MQKIMATVSGAAVTSIKLLTSGLGFTEKRDALFNLLRHRAVPLDQIDHIQSYLEALQTFTPLRNDITHSVWIEGKPCTILAEVQNTLSRMRKIKSHIRWIS
jgi:hypothetical protein